MTEKELLKLSIEEFSRVQDWMELADKESEVYKSLRKRYIDLKVILTSSGINLTEIDRIKEQQEAIQITVIEQIKAACDVAGISATELGKRMGMSQQNFSKPLQVGKFLYNQMAEILGAKFIFRYEFPNGSDKNVRHCCQKRSV